MNKLKNISEYQLKGVQKEIELNNEILKTCNDPKALIQIYQGIFGSMVVRLESLFGEEYVAASFESSIETIRKIKNKKAN